MQPIAPAGIRAAASTTTVPSWPAAPWRTWEPTHDRHMAGRGGGSDVMKAAPIMAHADAVAQADFAFGGNYQAHGSLDVFRGEELLRDDTQAGAVAAAQALNAVHGIVGVFKVDDHFSVRELLVSDARYREAADDYRSPRPTEPRERPAKLVRLTDIGEPNGSWGHGDFRTLSALRFADDSLVGFVRGADRIER